MAERYRDVWIAETQLVDVEGAPLTPWFKGGLTPAVISAYPELDWMIDADQGVVTPGSAEAELVWVLAEDWDHWREMHPDPDPELARPATPPM